MLRWKSVIPVILALAASSAHATLLFHLSTDFGQGQIEVDSTQGFLDSTGSIAPVLTDGSPGVFLGFEFDVSAPAPVGPRTFGTADVLTVEWLTDGADLLLRLSAFFISNEGGGFVEAGLTLSRGARFSSVADTFCTSIGRGFDTQNVACVFGLGTTERVDHFAVSDSVAVERILSVPEPATTALLTLGLLGAFHGRVNGCRPTGART